MDKKRFELWLPFTASAIGVAEQDLPIVHNKPMKLALARASQLSSHWECSAVYFTEQTSAFLRIDDGLTHRFFPISLRKRHHSKTFGRQFSFSALCHLILDPPDLVGLYGGYGRFTMTAAWTCRLRRIPYYVHFGGWPVPSDSALKRLMQNATYVITFTERQRRWMAAQGIYSGPNTASWPIGVDMKTFRADSPVHRSPDSPHLIYVGRITHNKGVLEAVQAFRAIRDRFPKATLAVIGSHQDLSFVDRIRAYLKGYALEDAVNLPGAVPYEALPKWYAMSDLCIFPSPLESFGFVVVESMACGTPVIALRGSGGPEEIITHGQDGILTDLPNLALEAIRLLSDRARLDRMGACAIDKVRSKYTLEQAVQTFASFLDGLPVGAR